MKQPLKEVLKEATKGPLVASRSGDWYIIHFEGSQGWPASLHAWCPSAPANAALLAHFRNVGPELVEALDDLLAAQIDPLGVKAHLACKKAASLLSRAKEVEVP